MEEGSKNQQTITWDDYRNRKSVKGCRRCNYRKRREAHNKTYEEMLDKFENTPYILIESKEKFNRYTTVFDQYLCKCKERGHHVYVSPIKISSCYKCKKAKRNKNDANGIFYGNLSKDDKSTVNDLIKNQFLINRKQNKTKQKQIINRKSKEKVCRGINCLYKKKQ